MSSRQSPAGNRESQLDQGLAFLFGADVLAASKLMSLEQMAEEAEQVAEGARQLRLHHGQPEQQRRIVQAMAWESATALCRWICDPDAGRKVLQAIRH